MRSEEIVVLQDHSWAYPQVGWPWWVWALTAALIFSAIAFAVFVIRRRNARTGQDSQAPAIPAHVKALEALRLLERRLVDENEMAFIVEVSRILRIYIQDRFNLRAPHRSTEEFLWEASESPHLNVEEQDLLANFLGLCDRVKFARQHVAMEQRKDMFATARRFVEKTAEREPEPCVA